MAMLLMMAIMPSRDNTCSACSGWPLQMGSEAARLHNDIVTPRRNRTGRQKLAKVFKQIAGPDLTIVVAVQACMHNTTRNGSPGDATDVITDTNDEFRLVAELHERLKDELLVFKRSGFTLSDAQMNAVR